MQRQQLVKKQVPNATGPDEQVSDCFEALADLSLPDHSKEGQQALCHAELDLPNQTLFEGIYSIPVPGQQQEGEQAPCNKLNPFTQEHPVSDWWESLMMPERVHDAVQSKQVLNPLVAAQLPISCFDNPPLSSGEKMRQTPPSTSASRCLDNPSTQLPVSCSNSSHSVPEEGQMRQMPPSKINDKLHTPLEWLKLPDDVHFLGCAGRLDGRLLPRPHYQSMWQHIWRNVNNDKDSTLGWAVTGTAGIRVSCMAYFAMAQLAKEGKAFWYVTSDPSDEGQTVRYWMDFRLPDIVTGVTLDPLCLTGESVNVVLICF